MWTETMAVHSYNKPQLPPGWNTFYIFLYKAVTVVQTTWNSIFLCTLNKCKQNIFFKYAMYSITKITRLIFNILELLFAANTSGTS